MAEDVRGRYARSLGNGTGTERIQFFSDAVFAIAMTLLVLEIRLPEQDGELTWGALAQLWPQFFAYALSFSLIGINWITHHRKYLVIVRFDGPLMTINLLLLGFVALLPFPTSVLADYGDEAPAVILYAFNVGIITVLQQVLWVHARRAGLTENLDDRVYRAVRRNLLPVPIVMGASILIALVSPLWAMFSWFLLWPLSVVVDRMPLRDKPVGPAAAEPAAAKPAAAEPPTPKPARRNRG